MKHEPSLSDKDREYLRDNLFLFALLWSLGAALDESSRPQFDLFVRRWLSGAPDLLSEFHLLSCADCVYRPRAWKHGIPEGSSVFDFFFDAKTLHWSPFALLVPSAVPAERPQGHALVVPTPETARTKLFLEVYARSGVNALLVGGTGTGKTVSIAAQLRDAAFSQGPGAFTSLALCFSAKTAANEVQDAIDARLDRRRAGHFAPSLGRRCVVFLDDLNMPAKVCGAQPVIELLRQWHTSGGWFDRKTWAFRRIEKIQFLAAMGVPGGSRQQLTPRYLRHFNLLYLPPFPRASLVAIFDAVLASKYRSFPQDIQTHAKKLVEAAVDVYRDICEALPPTPAQSHYTFNLRDLARAVDGLGVCSPASLQNCDDLFLCWFHELQRVFSDRLVCQADKAKVFHILTRTLEATCRRRYETLLPSQPAAGGADAGWCSAAPHAPPPLLFCAFADPQRPVYRRVSLEEVRAVAERAAAEHNLLNPKAPLSLVLFTQALKHFTRLLRILTHPRGNALLVGFGGSGRKTLTRLASFLAGFEAASVQVTRAYGLADWREDLKNILVKTGAQAKHLTFMLSDVQLANDAFLEDVANLLNTGEVPNIFSTEDKIGIFDLLSHGSSSACASPGLTSGGRPASGDLFEVFVANCREKLHIVLSFPPIGETLRHKIRLFPALVNCCAINWFSPWREPALEAVAREELRGLRLGSLLAPTQEEGEPSDASADTHDARRRGGDAAPEKKPSPPGSTEAKRPNLRIEARASHPRSSQLGESEETSKGDEETACGQKDAAQGGEEALRRLGGGLVDPADSASQLCSVFSSMQLDVAELVEAYQRDLKRFFYITPRSYLEFLRLFAHLSVAKRDELNRASQQYRVGLEKIHAASEQVERIRTELEALQPQLVTASQETSDLMASISKMQESAALTRATVEVEEAQCKAQADAAAAVKEQCQAELDKAMPALVSAIEALKKLSKSDITELNSMKSPPAGVVKVMEALCKMFRIKPAKASAGASRKDFWSASKKYLLSDTKFLQRLFAYDRDHIPAAVMAELLPYQIDPDFDPEVIKKASVAATSLCRWVRAIVVYDQVAKVVEPKQRNLEHAQAELAVAAAKLEEKKTELSEVQALVENLLAQHSAAERKKEELKAQFDDCAHRLQVAERLILDLAGEKKRWRASYRELKARLETLLGELLLTSGVLAYGGVFPAPYRQRCVSTWTATLKRRGVAVASEFDLRKAAGDALQIQTWVMNLLPNDAVSIENAIILSLSTRWPMLIDPQSQATRWLKKSHPAEMKVLRATDDTHFRALKAAIEMGTMVLIEHCSDELDSSLEPLFARAVFKAGGAEMIRLRDTAIDYSRSFRLFLSTLLSNPHFPPEHCAQLTLLDFSVTPEGLQDQLLGVLVAHEEPEIETQRQAVIAESAASKQQLQALEGKILQLLSNAKGDMLDDGELLAALSSSKAAAQRIEDRVEAHRRTEELVNASRARYRPVALRTARLFFVLADLATVDRMYQFSVEWFTAIFAEAFETTPTPEGDTEDLEGRLEEIEAQFLTLLYESVCRSLFEKDKLLFSLMLAFALMRADDELNGDQLKLLLRGGITGRAISQPKPEAAEAWLSDLAWMRLVELQASAGEGDFFWNFLEFFQDTIDEWRDLCDSEDPLDASWPADADQEASELEKCLLIQALRPECLVRALRKLVEEKLGAFFLEPPTFDLNVSYKLATPARPLVFALSSGADPMELIMKLARAHKMERRLVALSLGQGQGPKAVAAIETAIRAGSWVLLQNCHLGSSFLAQLERIVEDLPLRQIHPDFRLCLTSMPSPQFPVSILLNSVKVTNEPPRGLRQNMLRAYVGFDDEFLENHSKPSVWKNMLFALCYFHAMLLERRKFGPLGWNVPYEFSQSDIAICIRQLNYFVGTFEQVPWKTLKYLVAETNYGGRITDPWDRRLINYLIDDIYCPKVLEQGFCLSESDDIFVPPWTSTLNEYLGFIRDFPAEESPEVYTLHTNASMSVALSEASFILDTLLSLQPRTFAANADSGSASFTTTASAVAKAILEQLPGLFDVAAVELKYPIAYAEILNTVLIQELSRYNRLLVEIQSRLKAVQDAEKGLVLLTAELEELSANLVNNRVPLAFSRFAYPSLKPLSAWTKDLGLRLDSFQRWIDRGPPAAFWLSGFFFTQAFLTAILQSFSRRAQIPIDAISFDFEVLASAGAQQSLAELSGDKPAAGCYVYGLYLEGARWDEEERVVAEALPKHLFYEMPMIWFEPCEISRPRKAAHVYECPVYKTAARAGTLSTTGHSKNFLQAVRLPIDPEQSSEAYWAKRGVALLLQLSE
ncbi:putative dynein heavy chain [Besnoitia besnoiti]|uniref:Putative dynein heavy chain n=1 Tax=Besnoitia besnoiti TaxID=94643 RepID=A0A2A9MPS9_BESBE|nr:putative dynein heavy chain [Besnoitia besnoiti]PFH38386.1 putative dynein heavy chain [Besnoitia besnoiti]